MGHQVWQRANIMAAASYLREVMGREPDNQRVRALYEGLLEVMDPTRRVVRQQRELASATAVSKQERRRGDRRSHSRRALNQGPPTDVERRAGTDRRTGRDRRKS
jgi:hypothetical protein